MHCIAKYLLKALVAVIILTIPMSIAWEAIFPGRIYFCTDVVGLDYFQPGNWVHGEIDFVEDVTSASSRSMSDPDIIVRGWTTERLWMAWSTMFGASVIVAVLVARFRWLSRSPVSQTQSANKSCVATGDNVAS
jgi:hypothetical protein